MGHHHHHSHGNGHHHHHNHVDPASMSEKRLLWAVIANIGLTFVQVAGGIISGSLSLIADAYRAPPCRPDQNIWL